MKMLSNLKHYLKDTWRSILVSSIVFVFGMLAGMAILLSDKIMVYRIDTDLVVRVVNLW